MYILSTQRGSAAILAIIVMVFLGIIAAGVVPMVTNEVKVSKMNSDTVEAQFAAEAGIRRALAAFYKSATDWSWVNTTQPQPLIQDSQTKTYNVFIKSVTTNKLIATSGYPPADTYLVQSTGTVNNVSRTVSVNVIIPPANGGKLNDGNGNSPFPFTNAVFAGGSLSISQHSYINGSVAANGAISTLKFDYITGTVTPYAGVSPLPNFNAGGKFDATKYAGGAAFPSGGYTLDKPLYYQNGDIYIDKNSDITVTAPNGTVIIYATGNVCIDQNVSITAGSNILIIANGTVYIKQNFNKHTSSYGNLVVVANGAVTINQNTSISGSIISNGSIAINHNLEINYNPSAIDSFTLPGTGVPGPISVVNWR